MTINHIDQSLFFFPTALKMPFYSGKCREAEILASKCPFILGSAGRQKSWHQSSLVRLHILSSLALAKDALDCFGNFNL